MRSRVEKFKCLRPPLKIAFFTTSTPAFSQEEKELMEFLEVALSV
jgi:hypothetical protein